MHPRTDSFYLPTQTLLTEAPAMVQPSRESEAPRGDGNAVKEHNLF